VVWLVATEKGLARVQIGGAPPADGGGDASTAKATKHLDAAEKALARYLAGEGDAFDAVALDLEGITEFQRSVYGALRKLPAGETCSYGGLAAMAGRPAAARAVGRAMATNPLPLAIPCHRVLGSTGALHGYGAGGPGGGHDLGLKRRLLDLEGAVARA
jgi:methylated-DNA-[protein]-cysteine S-methyltransferase